MEIQLNTQNAVHAHGADESDDDSDSSHSHRDELEIQEKEQFDKFHFNQIYQDSTEDQAIQKQAYYVSQLEEVQEEEMFNEDFAGEITLKGEKVNQSKDYLKYEFPLTGGRANFSPGFADIFDISIPKAINTTLDLENQNRQLGQLTCVSVCEHSLAVGLKQPSSLIIWNDIQFDAINHKEIFVSLKHLGDLICLDFYFDSSMILVGFSTGTITFINPTKGQIVQSFVGIHQHRLICVKFLYRLKEEQLVTIQTDVNGTASLTNFKKGFFTYEISPFPVLKQMAHPGNSIQVLSPGLQEKYLKTSDDVVL